MRSPLGSRWVTSSFPRVIANRLLFYPCNSPHFCVRSNAFSVSSLRISRKFRYRQARVFHHGLQVGYYYLPRTIAVSSANSLLICGTLGFLGDPFLLTRVSSMRSFPAFSCAFPHGFPLSPLLRQFQRSKVHSYWGGRDSVESILVKKYSGIVK